MFLAIGFFLCIGTRAYAAETFGIHRISLTDDNPRVELSQQISLTVSEFTTDRTSIFAELSRTGDIYSVQIFPETVTLRYTLTDTDGRILIDLLGNPFTQSSLTDLSFTIDTPLTTDGDMVEGDDAVRLFELLLTDDSLLYDTEIDVISGLQYPSLDGLTRVSDIYQYDFEDDDALNTDVPFDVKISYTKDAPSGSRSIYYYDKGRGLWVPLPSYHHVENNYVTAEVNMPFAAVAIFEDDRSDDGIASWYAYKGCDCAASRVYPKGTELVVTRLKTGDQVVVVVNDYGPEEWTGRIIDLDKTAFEKIGSLGAGLIYVNVKPNG